MNEFNVFEVPALATTLTSVEIIAIIAALPNNDETDPWHANVSELVNKSLETVQSAETYIDSDVASRRAQACNALATSLEQPQMGGQESLRQWARNALLSTETLLRERLEADEQARIAAREAAKNNESAGNGGPGNDQATGGELPKGDANDAQPFNPFVANNPDGAGNGDAGSPTGTDTQTMGTAAPTGSDVSNATADATPPAPTASPLNADESLQAAQLVGTPAENWTTHSFQQAYGLRFQEVNGEFLPRPGAEALEQHYEVASKLFRENTLRDISMTLVSLDLDQVALLKNYMGSETPATESPNDTDTLLTAAWRRWKAEELLLKPTAFSDEDRAWIATHGPLLVAHDVNDQLKAKASAQRPNAVPPRAPTAQPTRPPTARPNTVPPAAARPATTPPPAATRPPTQPPPAAPQPATAPPIAAFAAFQPPTPTAPPPAPAPMVNPVAAPPRAPTTPPAAPAPVVVSVPAPAAANPFAQQANQPLAQPRAPRVPQTPVTSSPRWKSLLLLALGLLLLALLALGVRTAYNKGWFTSAPAPVVSTDAGDDDAEPDAPAPDVTPAPPITGERTRALRARDLRATDLRSVDQTRIPGEAFSHIRCATPAVRVEGDIADYSHCRWAR